LPPEQGNEKGGEMSKKLALLLVIALVAMLLMGCDGTIQ